jgi:hypothetical protein
MGPWGIVASAATVPCSDLPMLMTADRAARAVAGLLYNSAISGRWRGNSADKSLAACRLDPGGVGHPGVRTRASISRSRRGAVEASSSAQVASAG